MKNTIDKNIFFKLYIIENKSRKEVAEILHVSTNVVRNLSKKFNLYKMNFPTYAPWNKGKTGVQVAWNKGVKMSEEQKAKISQTKRNKSKEEKDAIETKRRLSRGVYKPAWNKDIPMKAEAKVHLKEVWRLKSDAELQSFVDKQTNTKRKNHSFNTSSPEEYFYAQLLSKFDKNDIYRQYKDERYPYCCDFYVKPKDLFIELNLHWSHGGHPFDKTDPNDLLTARRWEEKAKASKFYMNALHVWTERDVIKYNKAKENKLNYKCIYNIKEMDRFIDTL